MRVIVTGSCGFLGSHLLPYLQKHPDVGSVVGIDKKCSPHQDLANTRYAEILANTYWDFDTLIHLAASPIVNGDPFQLMHNNVNCLLNVLYKFPQIKKFIIVTTDKVLQAGNPLALDEYEALTNWTVEDFPYNEPYRVSKICCEVIAQYCQQVGFAGTKVHIVRFGNLFGSDDQHQSRLIPHCLFQLAEDKPIILRSSGKPERDWCHVEDACTGILNLLTYYGECEKFHFSGFSERVINIVHYLLQHVGKSPDTHLQIRNTSANEILSQKLATKRTRRELNWEPRHTDISAFGDVYDEFYQVYSRNRKSDYRLRTPASRLSDSE